MASNTWLHDIKEYFLWPKTHAEVSSGTKFECGTSVSFSSSSFKKKTYALYFRKNRNKREAEKTFTHGHKF